MSRLIQDKIQQQFLPSNAVNLTLTAIISKLSDLLLIPAVFALHFSMKRINSGALLVAAAFIGLYIIMDLAVSGLNWAALLTLSKDYMAANATMQTSYVAVANYAYAVAGASGLISSFVLAVGILITSFVMRKGIFGKATAYLGNSNRHSWHHDNTWHIG